MTNNKWDQFNLLFKSLEVPAKTTLLAEGDISKNIYVIKKGCLRTWVNNNGKEITTQFFFEGQSVSSIESFRAQQPSLYSIESIEPCVLQTLSQKDFQLMVEQSPTLKEEMKAHLFTRFIHVQKYLLAHLRDTPQQRYTQLLKEQPQIIQRVPQHYIASYLGITSVSLSRIRNRR